MKKKLLAIDVDGTLINDRLELTKKTESVLMALSNQGFLIVLASGRPWRSMADYYERLRCTGPVITYNGAHVYDPKDPTFKELKKTFDPEDVRDIADKMGKKITSFMCETGSMVYLSRIDDYLDHYFPYKNGQYYVGSIAQLVQQPCYTAIFRCVHKYDLKLKKVVEAHPGVHFRHWTKSLYSEACLEGASKGEGLRYIRETLGYAKEDVYAFGDSDNDYEMLLESDHPYAMRGCKSQFLTEHFPWTESDNNHSGVALTLEKLFLKP
jgi:hypothetical protein